jgi:hypothetical protein
MAVIHIGIITAMFHAFPLRSAQIEEDLLLGILLHSNILNEVSILFA